VTEQFLRERAGSLRVVGGPRSLGHLHGHARPWWQHIGAHRPHAATRARLRDHERPPLARLPARQRHEQVDAPRRDVVRSVDALVAHHLDGAGLVGGAEQARRCQRLQERRNLPLQLAPDGWLRRLEHRPARAALEAGHQQQPAPLRREQARVGAAGRSAGESLE